MPKWQCDTTHLPKQDYSASPSTAGVGEEGRGDPGAALLPGGKRGTLQPLWRTAGSFSKRVPQGAALRSQEPRPGPGTFPKTCTAVLPAAFLRIAQQWKPPKSHPLGNGTGRTAHDIEIQLPFAHFYVNSISNWSFYKFKIALCL